MRRALFALFVLPLLLLSSQVRAQQEVMCFPETINCLTEQFRQYWEQNGSLLVFGFPTTGITRDPSGTPIQWLERYRFEVHAGSQPPFNIQLGRLGDERLRQVGIDWQTLRKDDPSSAHYFAATGHAISYEPFWRYWSTHGLELGDPGTSERESIALFGLPISPLSMAGGERGDGVKFQWFERARFEDHGGQIVMLGLLGNEVQAALQTPTPTASATISPTASPTITPRTRRTPSPTSMMPTVTPPTIPTPSEVTTTVSASPQISVTPRPLTPTSTALVTPTLPPPTPTSTPPPSRDSIAEIITALGGFAGLAEFLVAVGGLISVLSGIGLFGKQNSNASSPPANTLKNFVLWVGFIVGILLVIGALLAWNSRRVPAQTGQSPTPIPLVSTATPATSPAGNTPLQPSPRGNTSTPTAPTPGTITSTTPLASTPPPTEDPMPSVAPADPTRQLLDQIAELEARLQQADNRYQMLQQQANNRFWMWVLGLPLLISLAILAVSLWFTWRRLNVERWRREKELHAGKPTQDDDLATAVGTIERLLHQGIADQEQANAMLQRAIKTLAKTQTGNQSSGGSDNVY